MFLQPRDQEGMDSPGSDKDRHEGKVCLCETDLLNTFLPYSDFSQCAKVLDDKRLNKQRTDCLALLKEDNPANLTSKLWEGYEDALISYGLEMCFEWRKRGFKDTCAERLEALYSYNKQTPPWLGDERLHASHRSLLVKRDPWHYVMKLGWKDLPDLPLFWPAT